MHLKKNLVVTVLVFVAFAGLVLAQSFQSSSSRLMWREWENRNHAYATKHVMRMMGDGTDRASILVSNFETELVDEYRPVSWAGAKWGTNTMEFRWDEEKGGWYGELPQGWSRGYPTLTIIARDSWGRVAYEAVLYELGRLQ